MFFKNGKLFPSGQFKYDQFKDEDGSVTIYGTTAYVIIKTNVKYKANGQDVFYDPIYLTFVKKEEQWLLAGECLLGADSNR